MFSWKSITKIPVPTFAKFSEKVGVGILVIDFQENIFMSLDGFQNLPNKFLFKNTSLSSLQPSISELRSKQKRNGMIELRGQADILDPRFDLSSKI
jgi:hypothetical protein